MSTFRAAIFAALAAFSLSTHAAVVVFDNTQAENSPGYTILGQNGPNQPDVAIGLEFTPTVSGYATSYGAEIFSETGSLADFTFQLYTNNNGAPGSLLDTATGGTSYSFTTYSHNIPPLTSIASVDTPYLSSVQSYWIIASTDSHVAWWLSPLPSAPGSWIGLDGGVASFGSYSEGSLVVMATPVPLPAAGVLLLSAIGGLGVLTRRSMVCCPQCA